MDSIYRHTQKAAVILWCVLPPAAFCIVLAIMPRASGVERAVIAGAGALLALLAWLFSSLTVTVDAEAVFIAFGPGLIHRRFALDAFASAAVVRNRWWHGWGIHLGPRGWLYNVSGFDAVELVETNGRAIRIGTDDAPALAAAVQSALAGKADRRTP